MNLSRQQLIERSAGRLPPFIRELRERVRDGSKTQTRRVVKPQPEPNYEWGGWVLDSTTRKHVDCASWNEGSNTQYVRCPYGKPGQIRYLREPLYRGSTGVAYYQDDDILVLESHDWTIPWHWKVDVLSGLFMPKEAARTFVTLKEIRVERVQEISYDDVLQEGVDRNIPFAQLWDSINAKRGYGWNTNPWVWVLVWELIEREQS